MSSLVLVLRRSQQVDALQQPIECPTPQTQARSQAWANREQRIYLHLNLDVGHADLSSLSLSFTDTTSIN